ncbi:TPA: type IVB secretion system protein DotG/IcmE [Legionella pneumophila]|nr:type IVB secretion system protein DotG/IcmE [Legionella pneumophila]HEI6756839.1 type IVB secretion system protein DotG/IcmE [Legionella pneumophila]
MASKKENLKSLFSNTRTRVIIIFTAALLIIAVVIGFFKIRSATTSSIAAAEVSTVPGGIQSIPGVLDPTAQYAKLQEEQNITQAQVAEKTGGSAIPTIIRTQALGEGVGVIGSQSGVGFAALAQEELGGPQRSLWIQELQDGGCSKSVITKVVNQGAQLTDLKAACSCVQLKDSGYGLQELEQVCECKELKAAGYNARQLKEAGYSAGRLRNCGFDACELRNAGFTAQEMKDGGFSDGELKGAGFSDAEIAKASGLPDGITADDVRKAGCGAAALAKLRQAGVSASAIRKISGCTAEQLKAAGYTAKELKDAGFTAKELRDAGFSAQELKDVGFSAKDLKDAGFSAAELKAAGFTAAQLKAAGFSAKDLKDAGFSAAELKAAGFSAKELKDAGFSASDLKNAGFSAKELKDAGFSASDLKNAGFSASELKNAGYSADELKKAGYTSAELRNAGFSPQESAVAGLQGPDLQQFDSSITGIPSIPGATPRPTTSDAASSAEQLQAILQKQNEQLAEQKYQQEIQQRTSDMLTAATQLVQDWKKVETQVYTEGTEETKTSGGESSVPGAGTVAGANNQPVEQGASGAQNQAIIKTGDIMFAVLDTAVNSDEPGPILATIVTGKLKGSKLIGSFNLPSNADKMVITFNTMSIPGAEKTISISAYAIDPNTARTALASRTNHHYLMRYGSLFASSFLQGFGNAFQSANTTITIGGTGGGNNITVANGVGRSTLENAVIGLATVGKAWSQQAQQLFNTPTTVEVYSGTGLGILFTQDVTTI